MARKIDVIRAFINEASKDAGMAEEIRLTLFNSGTYSTLHAALKDGADYPLHVIYSFEELLLFVQSVHLTLACLGNDDVKINVVVGDTAIGEYTTVELLDDHELPAGHMITKDPRENDLTIGGVGKPVLVSKPVVTFPLKRMPVPIDGLYNSLDAGSWGARQALVRMVKQYHLQTGRRGEAEFYRDVEQELDKREEETLRMCFSEIETFIEHKQHT